MSTLLSTRPSGPRRLRELLTTSELIVAPGAYDCLSARLIEAAGFPAVYMTGFGTAAAYLGRPDVGLLGMSERVSALGGTLRVANVEGAGARIEACFPAEAQAESAP